jgi:hypothetical protein
MDRHGLFELIFPYPGDIQTQNSDENECGWLPWIVQQWDYYYRRFRG